MKNQLEQFIKDNNILKPEQSGFRKNHSCETTIQHSFIKWRKNLDKGLFTGIVFVDFARAFETINRNKLLIILHRIGLRNTVFDWFKSYLLCRSQIVNFQGALSKKRDIKFGVPQGSKLGPILFNLYINEIISVLKNNDTDVKLFADDLMISICGYDIDVIESKLNECLKRLNDWLNNNQLKINVKKTVYMILHDQRIKGVRNNCKLMINNYELKYVTETKYLGIIIDDNLNLKKHSIYINKKIGKKINFLSRLGNTVTSYTRCQIYKTIVLPHFEYCGTIMVNYSENQLNCLQKLQNRAMRIVLRVNKYTNIKIMLNTLKWMSVRQKIVFNTCVFIHKVLNKLYPEYLFNEFGFDSILYETRNKSKLKIHHTRTLTAEKSIVYRGIKWYNELPADLRAEKRINVFKIELKNFIQQKVDCFEKLKFV